MAHEKTATFNGVASSAWLWRKLQGDRDMPGLQMKYFVLKPNGNDAYARASRMAMRKYAIAIMAENPELSRELVDWANRETPQLQDDENAA